MMERVEKGGEEGRVEEIGEVRRTGGGQETDRMEGVEGIRRGEKSRLGEVFRKEEERRLRGGGEERRGRAEK